jgi:hypothetical protein
MSPQLLEGAGVTCASSVSRENCREPIRIQGRTPTPRAEGDRCRAPIPLLPVHSPPLLYALRCSHSLSTLGGNSPLALW